MRQSGLPVAIKKLDDIQVLRGVAILTVIFHHLSLSNTLLAHIYKGLANPFYTGVHLFFIISGFVVVRSLQRGSSDPRWFLMRRFFRLVPPIFAFLVLGGTANAMMRVGYVHYPWAINYYTVPDSVFLRQAVKILIGTLIINPFPGAYVNGAMWTLSVEFLFYYAIAVLLMFGSLFLFIKKEIRLRLIFWTALIALAVCLYGRVMRQCGISIGGLSYFINLRFDFLLAGVLLSFVPDAFFAKLKTLNRLYTILLFSLPVIMLAFMRNDLAPLPETGPDSRDGIGSIILMICYVPVVAFAAGDNLSAHGAKKGWFYRILLWSGERSYSMYLLHFMCMGLAWGLMSALKFHMDDWSFSWHEPIVTACLLLPTVEFFYRFIELPSIYVGKQLVGRLRSKSLPSVTIEEEVTSAP